MKATARRETVDDEADDSAGMPRGWAALGAAEADQWRAFAMLAREAGWTPARAHDALTGLCALAARCARLRDDGGTTLDGRA